MVVVVPYDSVWPARFERLAVSVGAALRDVPHRIEHVGSTSVPGLAAKPIIDLDVVVASEETVARCVDRLAPLGYVHGGTLGLEGRHAFFPPPASAAHHLYACVEGSLALRNHLGLRDHLRSHPEDARAYGALKLRLAAAHPDDLGAYLEAKTPFLVGLLAKLGLDEDELSSIVDVNRKR